ncbi:MAG: radical SAM protein [bacterium]
MTKKIKTILITPPSSLEARYGKDLKKFGATSEPLGLAYLAANLEKHNFQVSIIDSIALEWGINEIVDNFKKEAPDLIGITVLTPAYEIAKNLIIKIKEELPNCKIIIGGAHATALAKESLLDIKELDYVCVGEGENTIVDLVKFLSDELPLAQIDGLVYRGEKEEIIFNQPRKFETNLDNFPPPAIHLLPMDKYKLTASRVKGPGFCPTLIIARGCPFNCAFCSHPFGRSFRHHSTERILSELTELINKYQVSQVNFEADTLTVNKKFLIDLCQALIDKGYNKIISWTCESRVDTVDEELLKKMREAGCWQISYGVESGVQRLLDLINKGIKIEKIEKVFETTKKIGITIRGFFMLGLPTETTEESWQTINFAKKLDPLWAQFTLTTPYPGTPLFEMLKSQNKIRTFNWSYYNTWAGWAGKEIPFVPDGRTYEELKTLQKRALISFYLRPKPILRFVRQIDSWAAFKKYFSGFLVLIKNKIFPEKIKI